MCVVPLSNWLPAIYQKPTRPFQNNNLPDGQAYKATYELNAYRVTVALNGRFRSEASLNAIKTNFDSNIQSLHTAEAKTIQTKIEEVGARYWGLALNVMIEPLTAQEMDQRYLKTKNWMEISTKYELSAMKLFNFADESKNKLYVHVLGDPKYARKWMDTIKKIDEHIEATKLRGATYDAILMSCRRFANPIKIEDKVLKSLGEEEFDFPSEED